MLAPRLYHRVLQGAGGERSASCAGGGWSGVSAPVLRTACRPARREFVLKDLRVFFRDTTQWSQLILLAVLLVVYVFNIKTLPLFTGEQVPVFFVSLVVFLNQGLAGFVLAAIAARFVFPAVSLEGQADVAAHVEPARPPGHVLEQVLDGHGAAAGAWRTLITFSTNVLLQASPFMMADERR